MAATQSQAPDPTTEETPAEPDDMKEPVIQGTAQANLDCLVRLEIALSTHLVRMPLKRRLSTIEVNGTNFLHVNTAGLESGSAGLYTDNPSLVFHAGYGYGPQMPYGPYSPVTTPVPAVGGDAQLYSPNNFHFPQPPYYQQLGHPNMSYVQAPIPVSHPEFNTLASIDQHGDNMPFGPRPSYPAPVGSFARGSFPGNHGV